MNTGYLIYQAERPRSGAEQRETDAYQGELAASLARRLHSLTAPLHSLTAPLRALRRARTASALDPDAIAARELASCRPLPR